MESLDNSAVKTYRYLRLGMVVLVVVLGASILLERIEVTPGCWQTSISAYYYTPVRPVLVGVLFAIGFALITVKGSSSFEDIVLNLAGGMAPVVAVVPTSDVGACMSVPFRPGDPSPFIDNNVRALVIGGLVSLALALATAYVVARRRDRLDDLDVKRLDKPTIIGIATAAVLVIGGAIWHLVWPDSFDERAHGIAAITMFVFIGLAIAGNALSPTVSAGYRIVYSAIVVAMVLSFAVFAAIAWFGDWDHWLLAVEATEIGLFAAFWAVQTVELWNEGMRPQPT